MFRFLLLKASLRIPIGKGGPNPSAALPVHPYLRRLSVQSLSTAASSDPRSVEHRLVRAHGFSLESARAVSAAVDPKLAHKLDTFVSVFKSHGFSPMEVAGVLLRYPRALRSNPLKNLKPKLDFLAGNGVAGETLVHLLTNDPYLLRRSLELQLAPCFNCLVSFFGNRRDAVSLLMVKRGTWVLHKFTDSMEININKLREVGVPDSNITKLMTVRPRTLSRDASEFSEIVDEIRRMGLHPSSLMFVYGVITLAGMKRPKWEAKIAVFKKFGWSDEQFKAIFVKQPQIMNPSEKRMEQFLNFFMGELGWTADELTNCPSIFMASFERRILPRMSILLFLLSEGLVKRKSLLGKLLMSEDKFLSKLVMENLKNAPHLLQMYEDKQVLAQFHAVKDSS
ncbi:hypothetical protein BT93_J0610 [Corymbia citriodora subsp. variegata]|nr:hypothetical protein BT93_J0610 [Corymbia citriodora subsp. variegata]